MLLARRLMLALAVLMALMALAVAVAPPPPEPQPRTETAPVAGVDVGERDVVEERIFITDDSDPTIVEANVGDTIRLEIHGTTFEGIELVGLDLFAAVSPEAPAAFEILADRPGSYAMLLTEADREIGRIEVTPRE